MKAWPGMDISMVRDNRCSRYSGVLEASYETANDGSVGEGSVFKKIMQGSLNFSNQTSQRLRPRSFAPKERIRVKRAFLLYDSHGAVIIPKWRGKGVFLSNHLFAICKNLRAKGTMSDSSLHPAF